MESTQPIALAADERVELERLRAEVASLRAGGEPPATTGARPSRVRRVIAVLLIVLASILAPLSVASVWVSTQVTDTDAYVETVAPLIEDPAVQDALASAITTEVFNQLDISSATEEVLQSVADRTDLPPAIEDRLIGLAVPITDGVEGFVSDQVRSLVGSDDFQTLWVDANRVAHEQLVATLTGQTDGAVEVTEGTVSVNLAPFVQLVKERLVDRGFSVAERIPDVSASFVVLQSADLARAQRLFAALDTLGTVFPFIVLALFAGGVLVATDRRRALVGAGLGLAASMVVLAIALALARSAYLGAVPPDVLPRDAAITVFDTLVRFLRPALRLALLLGLVVAGAAFLAGPSSAAVATRRVVGRGIEATRGLGGGTEGLAGSRVGGVVRAARRPLQVVSVAVAALVLVFWDQPTPGVLVGIVLVLLLVLALIELLASRAEPAAAPEPDEVVVVVAEVDQEPAPPEDETPDPQPAPRAAR